MRQVLRDLGVSVEVSRVRALVESYVPRPDGTAAGVEEESRGILASAGVTNFDQRDVQRIAEAQWRPYVQNVRIRKGVKQALELSRTNGLKLGVVANIWSGGMDPVLARFGIEELFDATVASMDAGFAKPDPRIFHLALNRLQLAPEQVIMVGDNPKTDIKGAHDLGMGTVRLMRGPNRTEPDWVEPDFKISSFTTLASIIRGLIERR